jgi:hypothetical protein
MKRSVLNVVKFSVLSLSLVLAAGCGKKSTDTPASSTGSGTGAGGTFTAADIAKTWTGACTAQAEAMSSGADHYQDALTLSGGGFSMQEIWYTGTCSPGNYAVVFSTTGTFAVGAVTSGTTQSIVFTATASDMMAMTTTFQTAVNSDCGGTSPYIGGASVGNNGAHFSTYMMNCMHVTFPNSGRKEIDNVATYTGGVLTLGAYPETIPGVFAGGSVPSTATVAFH